MRHYHFFSIMLLAVVVVALAACGGAATQAPTPQPTQIPPTVPPPTAAATAAETQAPAPATQTEAATAVEVARPSNAGGPGDAINLKGDAASGAKLYTTNCQACHGAQGKGGVKNDGSDDGEVPALNPIDSSLIDKDAKVYATNLDLFIEHGSTPSGSKPTLLMPAFGDQKTLKPQEIADLIAYLMSLNPAQ